jgi:anti-sigma-K factor RskA
MDYSKPELADRLAAEYVLGTLRGPARRRFETLLLAHPALERARQDWERRLSPLSSVSTPVSPSSLAWTRIEQRLFAEAAMVSAAGTAVAEGVVRWWRRLGLWQGAAGLASAAVVVLAAMLARPPAVQPPIVVVMAANAMAPDAAGGIQPVSFVASVGGDGRSLVIKPLNAGQQIALDKALELWAIPAKGQPRSLGVVSHSHATTLLRTRLLDDTTAFAVTVEPPGGSPTGAPTGPIVSLGKVDSI